MWLYLLGTNELYPDPVAEIGAMGALQSGGAEVYLKLSTRDDAPLKNAKEGASVLLCTRSEGTWSVHAEAKLAGPAIRGATPSSVGSIYGPTGDRHWWRPLSAFRMMASARRASEFGIEEASLPEKGQAHVIRVKRSSANGKDFHPQLDSNDLDGLVEDDGEIRVVFESSEDVTIDDQGRIIRYNGEQILSPGHEPATILRALADVAAGRMVTIDELRARRK